MVYVNSCAVGRRVAAQGKPEDTPGSLDAMQVGDGQIRLLQLLQGDLVFSFILRQWQPDRRLPGNDGKDTGSGKPLTQVGEGREALHLCEGVAEVGILQPSLNIVHGAHELIVPSVRIPVHRYDVRKRLEDLGLHGFEEVGELVGRGAAD